MHLAAESYDLVMNVRLGQLRALVAVADEGTFTDAAAALGISQAAVSRTVAALEAELGVRLIRRTTRQATPTALGGRVIARARRVLAEVGELERLVDDHAGQLRVGYSWSALGRHTLTVQRRWAAARPNVPLVFIQSNSPTAGLSDGTADVAVLRRPVTDRRFDTVEVGRERRYAAVAADDAWARRRFIRLTEFAGRAIGIDARTGSTTLDLWPPGSGPAEVIPTHSVDDWLTLIAGGQAVGLTAEATAAQYPRPGVVYRPVRDVVPVTVWLGWWRDEPPVHLPDLIRLIQDAYGRPDTT
jgi:DNA-binding transcriptional LysR family regulator